MDKNTITGFVLMALVLVGYSYWSRPSQAELEAQARYQDSIMQVQQEAQLAAEKKEADKAQKQTALAADSSALFFAARQGKAQEVVLQNSKLSVSINTQGAAVQEATILGYKDQQKQDVKLLTKGENQMELTLAAKMENIRFSDLVFQPTNQTDSTVTLLAQASNGGQLSVSYKLRPNTYVLDMIVESQGLDGLFSPNTNSIDIRWQSKLRQQEKGFTFENRYSTLTYKRVGKDTKNLSQTKTQEKQVEENMDWIAFKDQFFSAILIAQQDLKGATLQSEQLEEDSGYLKNYTAHTQTLFDPSGKQPTQLQMYLGPNNYHILKSVDKQSLGKKDLDIEDLVDFGWPLVRWINRFFILYLFDWLTAMGLPMGIVLLLLTIIVKALVYPATRKTYLSSARMRVLKPELDKINAKYPNPEDALKKQQESMTLYSQYGVSPMGGCLPMLIQMPIWIALFNFVPNAIELRGQSFLWADDLSAYDSLIHWDKDLWLIGDHISIFCLLFTLTNLLNTVYSMRQQQQSSMMSPEQQQQMKMMQWMMYIMPVVFFFMFNSYSSGLCYYYFLSGISSILIMWALRHFTDDEKLMAQMKAYKEKNANNPRKQTGMAARLEALQKMAEEQQRQQQQKR